jgi:hypothetical protein
MQPVPVSLLEESSLQRDHSNDGSLFAPGQCVIWTYRPQRRQREIHDVTAEVV